MPLIREEAKSLMKLRNADSCLICKNSKIMKHADKSECELECKLECNANVLCRFEVKQTQVCDYYEPK